MKLEIVGIDSVNLVWPQIEPMIDDCVKNAAKGEISTEDIWGLLESGKAMAVIGIDDSGDVDIVAVFEANNYPRMRVLNLFALGGKPGCMDRYGKSGWIDRLKSWAVQCGYDAIDASVSPAMLRIVNKFGFKQQYFHTRCYLGEPT